MANQPKNDAKPIRPLWIIANVLLTIAVCLLLVVIKNRLDESHKESSLATSAEEDQTPRTIARDSPSRQPVSSRPTPSLPRAAKAGQSPVVENVEVTVVESSSSQSETALLQIPGGVIVPSAVNPKTNLATAIAGRVVLRGEPPPEDPIDMSASPPCAKLQTNAPTTRNFILSPDGGLADVFVSIVSGVDHGNSAPPRTNLELTFVSCQIQPYVSGAIVGQRLTFKNADSQAHTIQVAKTNHAPFATIPLSPKANFVTSDLPQRPENFLRITCKQHGWELAYVSLVDHPYFAVTDTNGNFVIPNVPPGRYMLRALHLKAQGTNNTARVTVEPKEISQVNFTLDAPGH